MYKPFSRNATYHKKYVEGRADRVLILTDYDSTKLKILQDSGFRFVWEKLQS